MSEENKENRSNQEAVVGNINNAYEHPPVERAAEVTPALRELSPVIGEDPQTLAPSPDNLLQEDNNQFPREIRRNENTDMEAATETVPLYPRAEEREDTNRNEDTGPMGQAMEGIGDTVEDVTEPVTEGRGNTIGFIAIGLSILALFIFPVLMSLAGIITGYIAFRRNARTTGLWAMGIGIVALLASIVFAPFFG